MIVYSLAYLLITQVLYVVIVIVWASDFYFR